MTNLQLFEYSGVHPEPIIDPYYNRDKVVIPPTVEETNDLVEKKRQANRVDFRFQLLS